MQNKPFGKAGCTRDLNYAMAAWHLAACARVRVVVSMVEAQLRDLLETSLTLRWSVALTMLDMMSRTSLGIWSSSS